MQNKPREFWIDETDKLMNTFIAFKEPFQNTIHVREVMSDEIRPYQSVVDLQNRFDRVTRALEKAKYILASIERRAGSASQSSGFTDAHECAQWAQDVLKEIEEVEKGSKPDGK